MENPMTVEHFARAHAADDKKRFLTHFPHPFLVLDFGAAKGKAGEFATLGGPGSAEKSTEFEAVSGKAGVRTVHEIVKSTRNSFHNMITLGRAPNNDVVLPHGSVSKFHAYFRKDAVSGRWSAFDAGSSFGTKVNGREVDPVAGFPLGSGDTLAFATVITCSFFLPADFHDYLSILKRAEKSRIR